MKPHERDGNHKNTGGFQTRRWLSLVGASDRPIRRHPVARADDRRGPSRRLSAVPPLINPMSRTIWLALMLVVGALSLRQINAYKSTTSSNGGERMVRLCIASVDPIKLTSQCVMCNRRQFPLTVIDCTGITKVNDLIASPLSVQEATCLIYNCRRQVPDVKPEPYHGSVSHAVNYRGAASSFNPASMGSASPMSGSSAYEMMTPSGVFEGIYPISAPNGIQSASSPYMTRFGSSFNPTGSASPQDNPYSPYSSSIPRGMIGGPSLNPIRQQALPYALVPAPRSFPFGPRKYNAALVPLFR